MQTIKIAGKAHALGKRIGKGGEGEVYAVDGQPESAVKIYKEDLRPKREPKVRAMVGGGLADTTNLVAFPSAIATDPRGGFIGFLMRLVSGYRPLHELYSPKSRKFHYPTADYRFLIRAALNVANAVGNVHQTGCVIGDFNHSGVLVSTEATVALIDADSFQFTLKGKSFPCVVGVPDFTPPELHGVALATAKRTQSHDHFGLAIAIFHLLAMGKHPYAGLYAGGDISMSEAIAQNRFAFSQIRTAETRTIPPPGSISLKDFPPRIASAFEAAFSLDPAARPDAGTWVTLLKELESTLSHCTKVRTHYYPSAAGTCVWCRLAGQSGVDMFPDLIGPVPPMPADGPFDIEWILAELRAVKLPDPSALIPKWTGAVDSRSQAVRDAKRRLLQRKLLGAAALIGALVGFAYATNAAIIWVGLGIFGLIKLIGGTVEQAPFKKAYADADARARTIELAFLQRIGLIELTAVRDDVERWAQEYRQLDSDPSRELARLKLTREARQRDAFLDHFPIRLARIPGIGPGKTATLTSFGIETAADVTASAVRTVPGFGDAMTAKLVAWRQGLEAKFRYNPAPDPSDIQAENAARAALSAKRAALQSKIRSGLAALQTAPQLLSARARAGDPGLMQALGARAQAAYDLTVMGIAVPDSTRVSVPHSAPPASAPHSASSTPGKPNLASSSPKCPQCGGPMRLRTANRGYRGGRQFWGCSRYPTCRGSRNL